MKKIILSAAGIVLLASITLFGACQVRSGSTYKTFSMTEGIAHFSFEYPSKYEITDYYSDNEILTVTLTEPFNKQAKDSTKISVGIVPGNENYPQDYINSLIRKRSSDPDFNLQELEQADLFVSGKQAKLFVYQERDLGRIMAGVYYGTNEDISTLNEIIREAIFYYNNLAWVIAIDSDSSTAEVDKADFDHVIQTFKILE